MSAQPNLETEVALLRLELAKMIDGGRTWVRAAIQNANERDDARRALKASEEEFRGLVARHDQTLRELDAAQALGVRLERERDAARAHIVEREKWFKDRVAAFIAASDEETRRSNSHAHRANRAEARVAILEREVETLKEAVLDSVLEGMSHESARSFNAGLETAAALIEQCVGKSVGGMRVISATEVAAALRAKKVAA